MKGVEIDLGGKKRTLSYDLNAIALIGEKLGIKIRLAQMDKDFLNTEMAPSDIRMILWAGLLHNEPDLKEEDVGAWVDQDNVVEVLQGFFGLFGEMSLETKGQIASMVGVDVEELAKPMTEDGIAESAKTATT